MVTCSRIDKENDELAVINNHSLIKNLKLSNVGHENLSNSHGMWSSASVNCTDLESEPR